MHVPQIKVLSAQLTIPAKRWVGYQSA